MKKIMMITLVLVSVLTLSACQLKTGENGTHTGYITAVQQSGYIWRNYKIFIKTDKSSSQEDKYCIETNRGVLAEELRQYSKDGKKVTINYDTREKWLAPWLCNGDYITGFQVER